MCVCVAGKSHRCADDIHLYAGLAEKAHTKTMRAKL